MSSTRCILLFLSVIVGVVLLATATPVEVDEVTAEIAAPAKPKLKVKVYYEALCGDSMYFIRGQLYNAMANNDLLQYTDLQFVPYGKVTAWTDPSTNITSMYCQHGHEECELNALHACIVEHNSIEEQLKMFHCLLRSYSTDVNECSSSLNIDISAAKQCKATRSTPDILKKYGADTDKIDITFVPSIAIDGFFIRSEQRRILNNFSRVFCAKYTAKYDVVLPKCS